MKRNLEALFLRERGDRQTLIPMLEKLSAREAEALYRFIDNLQMEAAAGTRRGRGGRW